MSPISLIDIINIEYSLGNKILCNNKPYTAKSINNTCKIFNEITKIEFSLYREEYYKLVLPKKIEDIIEKKMFALLKNKYNLNVYKKVEEYEEDLKVLALKINEYNYDSVLTKMINLYQENFRDYDMCRNTTSACYISGILMKEFYNFIKFYMKYELKREEFDNEDVTICDMIRLYNKV
jgi:hypothetical protein